MPISHLLPPVVRVLQVQPNTTESWREGDEGRKADGEMDRERERERVMEKYIERARERWRYLE